MKLFKKYYMSLRAAAAVTLLLSFVACQEEIGQENGLPELPVVEGDCFFATIEETAVFRTAIGESGESSCTMAWSEDDRVTAFMQNTSGWQYVIGAESVGMVSAEFVRVQDETSAEGAPLAHNVIWYPYDGDVECTAIDAAYELAVFLPTQQTYAEKSFSCGAFPMVAVEEDRNVSFKNVCGGIKFLFRGSVAVASIEVEGKDLEPLSGAATVTAYADGTLPKIEMASGACSSVILNCAGVQLQPDTATEFVLTLPPVTFTNGFTVIVTDVDGHKYIMDGKSGSAISRSSLLVMPEVVVDDYKTIRILAIGNSFSVDAMEYLYGVLWDLGYRKICLGDMYKAGCSLEEHAGWFAENEGKSYTFYQNTTGEWIRTFEYKPLDALHYADWDFITMQQGSKNTGLQDTFEPYLGELLAIVRRECPDAKLFWHMTWAYHKESDHVAFPSYGSDQMTMYNAIVGAVKAKVLVREEFVNVIPNGTAVQNMRTSFLQDNLTRDGYHLSLREGRFLAALTYAKILTGCDLADISYTPEIYEYDALLVAAIKDAVDKSCANPYEVTMSSYPLEDYPERTPFTNEDFEAVSSGYTSDDWK